MEKLKKIKWSVWIVLLIGHISIFGKLIDNELIQGLGFMTAASPLPLVFSKFRGIEGFASQFRVNYINSGQAEIMAITPQNYQSLKGPYNRRNAFGAAIAGAPMLTGENEKKMVDSVISYSFCTEKLKKEFQIPGEAIVKELIVESKTRGAEKTWTFQVACND